MVGFIPLIPFLVPGAEYAADRFLPSSIVTGFAFAGVGLVKAYVLEHPVVRSGVETLLIGGGAAVVAYGIGLFLGNMFGI